MSEVRDAIRETATLLLFAYVEHTDVGERTLFWQLYARVGLVGGIVSHTANWERMP